MDDGLYFLNKQTGSGYPGRREGAPAPGGGGGTTLGRSRLLVATAAAVLAGLAPVTARARPNTEISLLSTCSQVVTPDGNDNSETLVGGSGCDQDIVDNYDELRSQLSLLIGPSENLIATPTGNQATLIGDAGTCTANVASAPVTIPCGQYVLGGNGNTLTSTGPGMLQFVAALDGQVSPGVYIEVEGSGLDVTCTQPDGSPNALAVITSSTTHC